MADRQRRRQFVKLCAAAITAVGARPHLLAANTRLPLTRYARVALVRADGEPLAAADLDPGESYLFHYPYATTPCFVINLGADGARPTDLVTEDGRTYRWQGGVGPGNRFVAFSAICAHKMSHPARAVSFIDYRATGAKFLDSRQQRRQREQVIFCCSERSVYDPRRGARVLGGPAPQPLASIELEYDAGTGGLFATGTRGGEMFEQYFDKFGFRLQLEHGISDVRTPVGERSPVYAVKDYCATLVKC